MTLPIMYLLSVVISYSLYASFSSAYDAKVKRLGYVEVAKEKSKQEKLISRITNTILEILLCGIPLFNLFCSLSFVFKFEKLTNDLIQTKEGKGSLKRLEDLEEKNIIQEEYLANRIAEVKEFQKELGYRNKVTSISEFTVDEKIAFYLRELELLYEEKARLEGIDLTEKVNFFKEDEIKKTLSFIDHQEPYK